MTGARRISEEKLEGIKDIVLRDASRGEKKLKELAIIYGVSPQHLSEYYKMNGIKKKKKYDIGAGGSWKGRNKTQIEKVRDYIKENNHTRADVVQAILSIFPKRNRR